MPRRSPFPKAAHFFGSPGDLCGDDRGMIEQQLTGLGDGSAILGAIEQRRAEFGFKFLDMVRQRGLWHRQSTRRLGQ